MIKGTLLERLPIVKRFSVENFLTPKTRTCGSVFRTPWKNPWTNLSETYGHVLPSQALRPAIYGAKQRLAVFTEIRLIKKLDLVCRKRAVSNSRPTCQEAFLKFVVLLVFTRVSRSMLYSCSAYVQRKVRSPYISHACIVSKRLNLSSKFFHYLIGPSF